MADPHSALLRARQDVDTIRELAGYVEDGSNATVRIYQDDATRSWFVSVGGLSWFGDSLSEALGKAQVFLRERD